MSTTQVGIKLTLDGAQQTEAGLRRVAGGVESVGQSAGKAGSGLSALGVSAAGLVKGLGAAFAVNQLAAFSQELVAVQRRFDVLNASLVTVSGSQAAAAREFEWIREFAATTPFQLNEVTQAFIKLKSLGLDASRDSLASYGNTAAALGKNLDQLIEAVADASTGEFERLKEFGIRASKQGDEIALTFKGVTTTIGDSAEEITRYLRQIGEVDFAGAMNERAKTLDGAISNLADSWEGFVLTITRSGFGDAVAGDVRRVSSELSLLTEVMENARQRGDGLGRVLADGLGAALGRLTFSAVEGTFNGFNGIVNALSGNVLNLNTNLDLLPDNLKSNADQVVILGAKLKEAEAEFARLQERAKETPGNPYLKSEMAQLQAYIGRVREARDAKALLEGGAGGGRGSVNPQTVGQINAEEEKAAAARAKARADFDAKYANDGEKLKAELAKQRKLLGDLFTPEDERRIVASFTRVEKKVKEVGDAFATQREFAKDWADAWSKADDLLRESTNESLGLNKAQEQLLAYLSSPAYAEHTEEMRQLVLQKLYAADAQIKLNQALQQEQRWMDESNRDNQRAAEQAYEAADALEDQVRQQRLANEEIGLTGYALADLKAARLEDAAAEKDRLAAIMEGIDPGIADEYRRQAKALRELASGTRAGAARDEAVTAAQDAEREWLRTSQEIERTLTDALMRGFESGKDFAEVLRDTVVNMFKTMVLRPVIQGVVQGGLNAVGLGAPGGGGSGLLGSAANAASLYNQLSTGTGLVGSVLASNAAYGAAIGTTSIGAGSQAAMLAAQTGQFGAAGVAATSQAAAGAGAGASSALSAIPGWGWALAGLALLAGSGFGRSPGEQAMGGYYSTRGLDATFDNARAITPSDAAARDLVNRPDAGLRTFTQQTVDSVLAATQNNARALGLDIALGIDAGFAANLNGRGANKNAFGYAQIFANGELAGSYSNRELGTDLTAAGQRFATDLADEAARVVLAGTDFARAGETASQTLTRLGGSLTTVNAVFDTLGTTAYTASLAGADMASQLADAFGGLDNLTALTSSYFEAYYTEGERAATATRQLGEAFGALGFALPESREALRNLVEAQDLTTESGRATYVALMQLAPAFANVTAQVERSLAGLRSAADQYNLASGKTTELGLAQSQQSAALAALKKQLPGFDANRFTEADIQRYLTDPNNVKEFQTILGPIGIQLADEYLRAVNRVNSIRQSQSQSTSTAGTSFSGGIDTADIQQQLQALTDSAYEALVRSVQAVQSVTNDAVAALQRAAQAEREAAQTAQQAATERIAAVSSVFDAIKMAVAGLYDEVSSTAMLTATEGRALIRNALSSGQLPEAGALRDAISAVRGGFDGTSYTTRFEQERDRLRFAAELSKLGQSASGQLSTAEQALQVAKDQLESIDAQVAAAQAQVDALRGIDTSVLSVGQAIAALQVAVEAETFAGAGLTLEQQLQAAQESINVLRGIDTSVKSVGDAIAALQVAVLAERIGTPPVSSPVSAGGGAASSGAGSSGGSGEFVVGPGGAPSGPTYASDEERVQAQIAAAQAAGVPYHVTRLPGVGIVVSKASSFEAQKRIPGYAAGGDHIGGLRLVGERGPELEVTGPSRIYSAEQTRQMLLGGNGETVAELRALREDNRAQAAALVRLQTQMNKILSRWDAGGMPEERVTA